MDSIWVTLIPLPFHKPGPIHHIDPASDVLISVPPLDPHSPFAPWDSSSSNNTTTHKLHHLSQSGLRIAVSSKHLTLASPLFTAKLTHFHPAAVTQPDGRIHLHVAQGFDARAAAIVLNAVHGKSFKVPKSVDLETLAQIAWFAHTFGFVEAVSAHAELWILRVLAERGVPAGYDRELVLWIYVSWVFGHEEVFREVTRVAAVCSQGRIERLGLPIGEGVVDAIDEQRQQLVARTTDAVYGVLESLSNESVACDELHCDAFLLGELVKTLSKRGVLWPRAQKPFAGLGHAELVDSISALSQHRQLERNSKGAINGAAKLVNGSKHPNGVNGVNGVNGTHKPVSSKPNSSLAPTKLGIHECNATKLVAGLGQLKELADDVAGLEVGTVG